MTNETQHTHHHHHHHHRKRSRHSHSSFYADHIKDSFILNLLAKAGILSGIAAMLFLPFVRIFENEQQIYFYLTALSAYLGLSCLLDVMVNHNNRRIHFTLIRAAFYIVLTLALCGFFFFFANTPVEIDA